MFLFNCKFCEQKIKQINFEIKKIRSSIHRINNKGGILRSFFSFFLIKNLYYYK